MNAKQLIQMIHEIPNFDRFMLTSHEEGKEDFKRFTQVMDFAKSLGIEKQAISYYNFIFLKELYPNQHMYFYKKLGTNIGTLELAQELINMSHNKSVVEVVHTQTAWGRKQIKTLPYGNEICNEMYKLKKTSLGTTDILEILFSIKAKELNFNSYNEFLEMMKLEKTMMGKSEAQSLLRQFWNNTNEEYKHSAVLFNTIKTVIININDSLISSNSNKKIRAKFVEEFLTLTLS